MRATRVGARAAGAPEVPSPIARLLEEPGSQLPAESSIILSTKLQGYRSGLAETYFKSKQPKTMKASESTELVQLKRKMVAMSHDFQTLLAAHEKQESNVIDLRQKVRALRQELEARDKSLELARRTVERLTAEKAELEAGAAGTQTYVRKLEGRLLSVKNAAELQQRIVKYKMQLDQMAHALHAAESRAAAAEDAAQQSQLDATCLKRGLELAAEQLTKCAGAEVPSTLLKAVARGQEEAMGLSVQLSDAKQQVAQLTAALEQAREHLQAQQQALMQQQEDRQGLRQRAEEAEAVLEKERAATAELRRVLDALKPKAGALAEERDALRQEVELQRTAAAEAQKEAKQLRAALKQKANVEAALRDELRRALAGEGTSPSPGGKHWRGAAATAAAADNQPAAAATAAARADSQRQQRHGTVAAATAAAQPNKRAGSSSGQPADRTVMRLSSAWEQLEHQQSRKQASPPPFDGRRGGRQQHEQQQQAGQTTPPFLKTSLRERRCQEQLQGGSLGTASASSGSGGDRIPAEPSPRALARLLEQRRQQQGSRLGGQQQQPLEPPLQRQPSWEDAGVGRRLDLSRAAQPPAASSRALGPSLPMQPSRCAGTSAAAGPAFGQASEPLSAPSTGNRGLHSSMDRSLAAGQQRQPQHAVPAVAATAADVLPVHDGRLMGLYTSALDDQISRLESDLAQLAGAQSPIGQLQQAARVQAAAATSWPSSPAPDNSAQPAPTGPQQQQQQEHAAALGAGGSWRPNSAFEGPPNGPPDAPAAALTAAQASIAVGGGMGMQQLLSPGASASTLSERQSGREPSSRAGVPPLWHSNPLAGGSPGPKQPREQWLPEPSGGAAAAPASDSQPGSHQLEHPTTTSSSGSSGVATGLQQLGQELGWPQQAALPASPDVEPADASPVAAQLQGAAATSGQSLAPSEAAWLWDQLAQAPEGQQLAMWGSSPGASSPSLCLPTTSPASVEADVAAEPASVQQHQQPLLAPQPHLAARPTVCGASSGKAQSLSHHWDLPSPAEPGTSNWLSNGFDADIERLEVSTTPQPLQQQQQQQRRLQQLVPELQLPVALHQGGSMHAQQQQQPVQPASSASLTSGGAATGSTPMEAERRGLPQLAPSTSPPLLPGLPVKAATPARAWHAATPEEGLAALPARPLAMSLQSHSLFDLAGMDMQDLLGE